MLIFSLAGTQKKRRDFSGIFIYFLTDGMKQTRPTEAKTMSGPKSHHLREKQARISSQHPEMRLPPQPCFYKEVNISFISLCLLPLQIVLNPRISAQLLGGVMG